MRVRRMVFGTAWAMASLLLSPASRPAGAQEAGDRLSLADYLDWEQVADPRISPDGGQVVFTRRWVDTVEDDWSSALWLMEADGSRKRSLVEGGGARWSPDGTRIAYTGEGGQIFVRWMDAEGATSQVTRLERGTSDLRWSPDGTRIAFVSSVEAPGDFAGVQLPDRPDGAEWTGEPKVVERAHYRSDSRGFIDDAWRQVFVVPADGGTARQLTDGPYDHGDPAWSADGTELYLSANRAEERPTPANSDESEIYAVDLATGALRQLTDRVGADRSPLPSPDGTRIAYVGLDRHDDTYRNLKIYLMAPDGSGVREISGNFDRAARNLTWAADGSGLWFNAQREGGSDVHFVSVDGGVRRVTEGDHVLAFSTLTEDGTAVGIRETAHEPGDVYRFDLDDPSDLKRLTRINEDVLAGVRLGEVEEIWYGSEGGFQVQGWIVKPPDFDPTRRYPLMLAIHGGPHGMYDRAFSFAFQEHAANGYVVLYTNPRGSTGYGTAFANAIDHDYPGADMPDLMAGVDTLLGRGYVDEDNLFVYGCSGGGILTAYLVGNTDRFAAASANCPIVDWMSAMGTSDAWAYTRTFEEYFWDDPTEWMDRSAIFHVGSVTTPTLLQVGENDLRTPVPQSEQFYQALKILGVPTAMIRYRDENHGTGDHPSNFMRTQLYLRKWFEKWGTHDDERSVTDAASALGVPLRQR